jgi:hypothetical protein
VLALIAVTLGVCFPIPTHDTVMRYAPMAEKFVLGEWRETFHPRFGVLFPALAGVFKFIFRCDSLSACSGVSMLAWAITIIPVYFLSRSIFGEKVAFLSVFLYLICPMPLLWALQGLREPYRVLGVVLMAAGIFSINESRTRSFVFSLVGLVILLLLRADTILFAMGFLFIFSILDKFRLTTWCITVIGLILIQLPCYNVWMWTGWWLPAVQYVNIVSKIMR